MTATKYKPTIGMEIHVELKTKNKMFCFCANETWKIGQEELAPNQNVCPVCLGHPGTLPVPNKEAIQMVIKAGLALNCQIATKSKFDRKNYFYPDLPKGYQISQYDQPLCEHGYLEINNRKIGVTRIHLEEDTGKLTHLTDGSLVDYNRAGVPLMEMVSEPDITSGTEAKEFCQELQAIFRELKISDANMEKGQMRCEVNISLSDSDKFGTKVEIKNLNSFKVVEKAIDYEIKRQTATLEKGEVVVQETRGWDEKANTTFPQRIKEGSADYRYFPEPDIPPLSFTQERGKEKGEIKDFIDVEKIKKELPELPQAKKKRFQEQYSFNAADARVLTATPLLADYAEQIISELKNWLPSVEGLEGTAEKIWGNNKAKLVKLVAGWLINKLGGLLAAHKLSWANNKITAENFAEFITMLFTNKISSRNGNVLLEKMLKSGGDPSTILEDENLSSTGNEEIDKIVETVINKNSDQVTQYRAGKEVVLKFLIGQVMKESRGKADPQTAEELLKEKIK